jgi:bacterioferritin (cytochrome b1)
MFCEDVIWDLNEVLNQETRTAISTILQLAVVIGADDEDVRSLYRQRIQVGFRHAQTIADLIVSLYGVPLVKTDFMLPPGRIQGSVKGSLADMLERDVLGEQNQAKEYKHLAASARAAGLNEMQSKMEECATDKAVQAIGLQRLLNRVKLTRPASPKLEHAACIDNVRRIVKVSPSNGTAPRMQPCAKLKRVVFG